MNATTVLSISHLSLGLRRLPKLNLTSLESPGKTAFHSAGLEKRVYINFKEPILCIFSLICIQWLKVDNLKSTVVGMFILQKSVHAAHQDLCFQSGELVDKHLLEHYYSYRAAAVPRRRVSWLQTTLKEVGRPVHWPRKGGWGELTTASIITSV